MQFPPSPTFPAWAHDDRWAWLLQDDEPLRNCTREYLDAGHWQHFWLVDSTLRAFTVREVSVTGRAGILGWRPGYKGTYVKVKLTWFASQLSLAEAKTHVDTFVASHPQLVASAAQSIGAFRKSVAASRSAQELLAALA